MHAYIYTLKHNPANLRCSQQPFLLYSRKLQQVTEKITH